MADLLTLDEVRTRLAKTEPLASTSFGVDPEWTDAERPRAVFGDKWMYGADGDPTDPADVWLVVPDLKQTFQLTFQAAQQLGSTCRYPQDLQISVPAELHQMNVNWWLAQGLGIRRLKLLLAGTGEDQDGAKVPLAVAQTRDTVTPFSNLALLDEVLKVAGGRWGTEASASARVHFTMSHDLEHTDVRVIFPEAAEKAAGEDWFPGVEFTNSCIGLKQTIVTGLACREASGAVVLDAAHSSGGFKRLKSTPEQAYTWAGESAAEVLAVLDGKTWENVAEVAKMEVGDHASTFVESLCHEFRVAKNLVERISAVLEDYPGELTMYALATSISRLGNMEGLSWREASILMELGGHVVHSVGARCSENKPCYRALPRGFSVPE